MTTWEVSDEARRELTAHGYTLMRTKSYNRLLERVRCAEVAVRYEKEANEGTREWARQAFKEQDRLRDRLEFVFSEAVKLGVGADLIARLQEADKEAALHWLTTHVQANADAAIIMHGPDEPADDVIQQLLRDGWTWDEERPTEYVAGKRVRYLRTPERASAD